jgi:hypothetical protein
MRKRRKKVSGSMEEKKSTGQKLHSGRVIRLSQLLLKRKLPKR